MSSTDSTFILDKITKAYSELDCEIGSCGCVREELMPSFSDFIKSYHEARGAIEGWNTLHSAIRSASFGSSKSPVPNSVQLTSPLGKMFSALELLKFTAHRSKAMYHQDANAVKICDDTLETASSVVEECSKRLKSAILDNWE